jgi:competence protein ComEC
MGAAVETQSAPRSAAAESFLSQLAADKLWRSPLVPVALFATAGVVADRKLDLPLVPTSVALVIFLTCWAVSACKHHARAVVWLWLAVGALAAACHHAYQHFQAPDDIGLSATVDGDPVLVRGTLAEEPVTTYQASDSRLRSMRPINPLQVNVKVTSVKTPEGWEAASGKVRLIVSPPLDEEPPADLADNLHAGDEVEVAGLLSRPRGPGNPGEFDHAAALRDQRVTAILAVHKSPDAVVRLQRGWTGSIFGWLGVVHGWCQRQLKDSIADPKEAGLAMALLLGRGAELTHSDWDKFIRTGVIHVLVISGQHVVVLTYVLWRLPPFFGVRRRQAALAIGSVLLGYMLLVGANPPIMRATIMVGVACVGYLLRRPVTHANSLAAAWLIIAVVNPTDMFSPGCQLTFISVIVLNWGVSWWFATPTAGASPHVLNRLRWFFGVRYAPDPLQQLVDESRQVWQQAGLWLIRRLTAVYLVMITVWLAVAPLVASHYGTLAPIAMLIGPPLILISAGALISGLLLLVCAAVVHPLVPLFAWLTGHCLGLSEAIVDLALKLPGSHSVVGPVPEWWLWGFYALLLVFLGLETLRPYWRWFAFAGAGWVCLGLLIPALTPRADELRCTFLAVGHGGCCVMETPDGRVLLYDIGAVVGPEFVERQVLPYLRERGIRRIDEVFLSHADLDHFNGLLVLCEQINVGQVTRTPTFAEKDARGVRYVTAWLDDHRIPVRIVHEGQSLSAGDVVINVLHPPEVVAESKQESENSRSMVLRIQYHGQSILLTGDLTGPGIDRLVSSQPESVDVLMAPHHGSLSSNGETLATALQPQVVISCQGPRPDPRSLQKAYPAARCFDTWTHGAVEINCQRAGIVVTTFRTGERLVVRKR